MKTKLSNKQMVGSYNSNGYLVINDILSTNEIEEIRAVCESSDFKHHFEQLGCDSNTSVFNGLTPVHPVFMKLAKHPAIVEIVNALIGDNVQLHHSKLMRKPPSKTASERFVGWHRDFAYFPHTNTKLFALMVMLDDATPENGCMSVVPASHTTGLLEHSSVDMKGFHVNPEKNSAVFEDTEAVSIEPKAGGISIHHCLTLHSSSENHSGKPRRGIVFQYRADDCYQLAGSVLEETGMLISGERTGLVRCDSGDVYISEDLKQRGGLFKNAWCQEFRSKDSIA